MPPPLKTPELHLRLSDKALNLLRLPSDEDVPSSISSWLTHHLWTATIAEAFISVTRTADEVSIVTDLPLPDDLEHSPSTSSFGAIKVQGR